MEIETAATLADYLGIDPDEENLALVGRLRKSAVADLCRASGTDWTKREDLGIFNEALRTRVWLSYYAVRDGAKNTVFLEDYLTGLVNALQLSGGE